MASARSTIKQSRTKTKSPNKKPAKTAFVRELAGIEYVGISGGSKDCQDAVLRLIHFGDQVTHVKILTTGRHHCLLLTINVGDLVAVKSGFASGYGGEGPRTFSYVLQILDAHGSEIEEYKVSEGLIERLDQSALTSMDVRRLDKARPKRLSRWHDYILDRDWQRSDKGALWRDLPTTVPLAIIDRRLIDLALTFWNGPDDKLMKGYRRLEDAVRKRTGLKQHSSRLFSQAFNPAEGKLTWSDGDEGEHSGRMNLFVGAFMAHRNRRAHRELDSDQQELLSEFLLLNHLYLLEASSIEREAASS